LVVLLETPGSLAWFLPSWGPSRVMYDGAFSPAFHATGELLVGVGWLAGLGVAGYLVLRPSAGSRA